MCCFILKHVPPYFHYPLSHSLSYISEMYITVRKKPEIDNCCVSVVRSKSASQEQLWLQYQ